MIGVRSFGRDPALVARHTAAYVEGLQSHGVAACTKHFPGHGDTSVDSHHALPQIDLDATTLHERELRPFRAAIEAGTRAVMTAHIRVPVLDPDRPATLSPRILTGLLRDELGYDGLIVTDGMEMGAVAGTYGLEHGVVLAIAAGADAICVGGGLADEDTVLRLQDALVTAVRSGELPEERLADAAARVRSLAAWTTGMRHSPSAAGDPAPEIGLTAARRAVTVTPRRRSRAGHRARLRRHVQPRPEHRGGRRDAVGRRSGAGTAAPGHRHRPLHRPRRRHGAAARGRRAAGRRRGPRRAPAPVDGGGPGHADRGRPGHGGRGNGRPQSTPRGAVHITTHGAARVCGVAAAEAVLAG